MLYMACKACEVQLVRRLEDDTDIAALMEMVAHSTPRQEPPG
jgi:hypothetical protein